MSSKIYVGNLLYEVRDQDLRDLFSPYGEVKNAEVVTYKKTKRSKGFGFVRMGTMEQAQAAIQGLNNQDYKGRRLFLAEARADDPTAEIREAHAAETPVETKPQMPQSQDVATPVLPQDHPPVPKSTSFHERFRKFGNIFSSKKGQ